MADDDEKTPEGLDDFFKKVFGGSQNAEDFVGELEDPMVEAWQGVYEIYQGLRKGGFTHQAATDVIAGYLYRLITGMGNGEVG